MRKEQVIFALTLKFSEGLGLPVLCLTVKKA